MVYSKPSFIKEIINKGWRRHGSFIYVHHKMFYQIRTIYRKSKSILSWKVYIIQAENGFLYTGITTNLERRFQEHLNRQKGARFFSLSRPKIVLFQENYPCRSSASKRECEIKKMSRKQKLNLISK